MKKIAEFKFRKSVKNQLADYLRQPRFVTYDKAYTFLLLFQNDTVQLNPVIDHIVEELKKDNKKVIVCVYINNKEDQIQNFNYHSFANKKTSCLEQPEKEIVRKIRHTICDVLIDFSTSSLPLSYLSLYSPSTFKIGTKEYDPPVYDFLLNISSSDQKNRSNNEVDELFIFEQVKFYLKNIQSND